MSEDIIKKIHLILKSGTTDSQKEWFAVGEYKKGANVKGLLLVFCKNKNEPISLFMRLIDVPEKRCI